MSNEFAISEDFEQYNDADELRRLIRAVRFSQKHYLYFVCCNQVPKQNQLIADIKKNLKGKKIRVVKFKKPITDLLGELQKKTISKDCEAVFVQGLEYSIASDTTGAGNALIHNLNISRDSFKKYLACPLFLWLPEYAIVKITRHAPDFFSVRSGVSYFSNSPEQIAEQIFQSVSLSWNEIISLSIKEKRRQIETLENLLAEYRGLHREKQDKRVEAHLLSELGNFFNSISENRKAIEFYEKSLLIAREIGDRHGEGASLGNLGNVYESLGKYSEAVEFYEKSLLIAREIGDRHGEGASLGNLGNTYYSLGEYCKAIELHEQSLVIKRDTSDRQGEGGSLGNLGLAYDRLDEHRKATEFHEQHLTIAREIGDRQGESASLGNLGLSYSNLGEYRKAIEFHRQSLAIAREIGDRHGEGASLGNLGNTYHNLNERKKACDLWKKALVIFEAIESPYAKTARQSIDKNCGSYLKDESENYAESVKTE